MDYNGLYRKPFPNLARRDQGISERSDQPRIAGEKLWQVQQVPCAGRLGRLDRDKPLLRHFP